RAVGEDGGKRLLESREILRALEQHVLRLADLGLFAALQAVAAALDGCDELGEVDLEGVEDVVGVVLGAQADLAFARTRVLDDLLGLALGLLDDLFLGCEADLLLARLADDPLGLALRLGEHLLTLLHDPARLLDLLRDRRAHLVEDVVDLLFVDAHLIRKGDGLGVVNRLVDLVDENEYVHVVPEVYSCGETGAPPFGCGNISRNRLATGSGTRSWTSPPNEATSLTPLEERKLY